MARRVWDDGTWLLCEEDKLKRRAMGFLTQSKENVVRSLLGHMQFRPNQFALSSDVKGYRVSNGPAGHPRQ